jgi:hypothetical protein
MFGVVFLTQPLGERPFELFWSRKLPTSKPSFRLSLELGNFTQDEVSLKWRILYLHIPNSGHAMFARMNENTALQYGTASVC